MDSTAPSRRSLALLFAGALAVRIGHLVAFADSPYSNLPILDAAFYDDWARTILAGDWVGQGVLEGPPLYPFVLALVYALFGTASYVPVFALNALLGATTAVLVTVLGTRALDRRVGLTAGVGAALFSPALFLEGQVLGETLALTLVSALLVMAQGRLDDGPWRQFRLGLMAGLVALCRQQALPFVALYGLALVIRRRRAGLGALAALALGTLLPILPATVRNLALTGDAVLLTANGGMNLLVGNGPEANGVYRPPSFLEGSRAEQYAAARDEASRRAGRDLSPAEVDAFWRGEALAAMAADPGRTAGLFARKLAYFFNGFEIPDILDFGEARDVSPFLWLPGFHLAGLLGLLGLGLSLQHGCRLRELQLYVLSQALFAGIFFMSGRYRVLVAPALLVFAADALVWLVAAARGGQGARLGGGVFGLLLAALVVFAPLPMVSAAGYAPAERLANNGAAFYLTGRLDEAEEAIRGALALRQDDPQNHTLLGAIRADKGDAEGALEALGQALRLAPGHPLAVIELAEVYLDLRDDPVQAEEAARAALQTTGGRSARAHAVLGRALIAQGRDAEGQASLERARELDPDVVLGMSTGGDAAP